MVDHTEENDLVEAIGPTTPVIPEYTDIKDRSDIETAAGIILKNWNHCLSFKIGANGEEGDAMIYGCVSSLITDFLRLASVVSKDHKDSKDIILSLAGDMKNLGAFMVDPDIRDDSAEGLKKSLSSRGYSSEEVGHLKEVKECDCGECEECLNVEKCEEEVVEETPSEDVSEKCETESESEKCEVCDEEECTCEKACKTECDDEEEEVVEPSEEIDEEETLKVHEDSNNALAGIVSLFDGENLTTEFKEKVAAIYEATINLHLKKLKNDSDKKLKEAIRECALVEREKMVGVLDRYITHAYKSTMFR